MRARYNYLSNIKLLFKTNRKCILEIGKGVTQELLKLQFLEKVRYFEELREIVISNIQSEIKSNINTPIKYFKTRIKSFERFQKNK
jgi:hypothetical protein